MLTIPNLPTQDGYVNALTLGPVPTTRMIKYVVANKAVFMRVWPQSKSGTIPAQTDELLVTPETNVISDAMGVQFRSALPGVPAQVVAQLLEPGDPTFGSGTPFSATISSSGGISPGVSAVQIQKDGALVAQEPIIDFITALGIDLTVADDPANTRALITLASGCKLLGGVVLGASAASITLSSIPATYDALLLTAMLCNDSGADQNVYMRLNGDAAAHYRYQGVYGQATVANGLWDGGALSSVQVIGLCGSSAAGIYASLAHVFPGYATGSQKCSTGIFSSLGTSFYGGSIGGYNNAGGAVSSITLLPNASNFIAGSRVRLYGLSL